MEGSHLGQNRAASNPRVPARSPGGAPCTLTRPPTGLITRGKTNKGSYYTLLMKDIRGHGAKLDTGGTKSADDPTATTFMRPPSPRLPLLPTHACLRAAGLAEGAADVGRGLGVCALLIEALIEKPWGLTRGAL